MNSKKYDFAVIIGRFRPFHLGHESLVKEAQKIANKVIILVGSKNKHIDWKNPWTTEEVCSMIKSLNYNNVYINDVEDRLYQSEEWKTLIYEAINNVLLQYSKYSIFSVKKENKPKIALVAFEKDRSSFYINEFPEWDLIKVNKFNFHENDVPLNASNLRTLIYENNKGFVKHLVPNKIYEYIINWCNTSENYKYVKDWLDFDKKYQSQFLHLSYGSNFYCADNVVIQSNHILLIKRKEHPGKMLWALPGGHIQTDETYYEGAVRELYEETSIKIPEKVLHGSFIGYRIFDNPERSLRGRIYEPKCRTISVSHCFNLDPTQALPRVKANDDAEDCYWFKLKEIRDMRDQIFEDHIDQIEHWVSKI